MLYGFCALIDSGSICIWVERWVYVLSKNFFFPVGDGVGKVVERFDELWKSFCVLLRRQAATSYVGRYIRFVTEAFLNNI